MLSNHILIHQQNAAFLWPRPGQRFLDFTRNDVARKGLFLLKVKSASVLFKGGVLTRGFFFFWQTISVSFFWSCLIFLPRPAAARHFTRRKQSCEIHGLHRNDTKISLYVAFSWYQYSTVDPKRVTTQTNDATASWSYSRRIGMLCFRVRMQTKLPEALSISIFKTQNPILGHSLHGRGFKSTRIHDLETASKRTWFWSVYTEPILPFLLTKKQDGVGLNSIWKFPFAVFSKQVYFDLRWHLKPTTDNAWQHFRGVRTNILTNRAKKS